MHLKEQEVIEHFLPHGKLSSSGELYLKINLKDDFVRFANDHGIAIIGIEFFHMVDNAIMPVVPITGVDCSPFLRQYSTWRETVQAINDMVTRVLEAEAQKDASLYFNPVLFDEEDWNQR
jgi:ABC-type dipeptide/oligopeptide/nickel transport system permease component